MSLQRTVGNAAVANMVRGGQPPPTALPAVQRMPQEESPAQELRSVFESDSESDSDSGSEATVTAEDTELPFHKNLRALRTVIRRGMNSPEAHGKPWTVTAKIDPGAPWTNAEFREGEVGHVWIEVTSPLGDSAEFGFYPQEPSFLPTPGVIICPDRHGGDKEQKTAKVGIEAVLLGYHAAFARTDATYSFTTYNCAGFASDIWESMTGKPLPNGLLIANPASAAESVETERELREAFAGQQTDGDLEDLIEMASSGLIPPAL